MNILTLTGTYAPSTNGVATSIANQKLQFENRGHIYTVVAPRHPHQISENQVIRLPSLPDPFFADYPLMVSFSAESVTKKLNLKYDLVFFHHPFYIGRMGLKIAGLLSCPSVFFYHSQYSLIVKSYFPSFIADPVARHIDASVISMANKTSALIVETKTLSEKLAKSINRPIRVISTSRDFPEITKSRNDLRKKFMLPEDKTIILCVSRMVREKNLDALINIYSKIEVSDNCLFVFAGDGPEKNSLESLASKLNLTNVRFLGNVPFSDIHEVYTLADIFTYTSYSDTQAIVIIEAMSSGLPVVAFKAPGPQDFVVDGENGYLVNTEEEFVAKLQSLILTQQKQREFGLKSKSLSSKYTQKNNTDETEKFFAEVISSYKN